jgi:hypothetical protein
MMELLTVFQSISENRTHSDHAIEIATGFKDQANEYFKEKRYKEARSFYDQALKESGEISSEMRRTLLSNRAACNLSLGVWIE